MPDVPTLKEAGVAGYEATPGRASSRLPTCRRPIVVALEQGADRFHGRARDAGSISSSSACSRRPSTPEEFAAYIRAEISEMGADHQGGRRDRGLDARRGHFER